VYILPIADRLLADGENMTCFSRPWQSALASFGVFAIGAIGFWIIAEAAETKAKAATLQKAPAKKLFVPCHAPGTDTSPDGKLFVNVNPDPPTLTLLEFGAEQKQRQVKLPKRAHDAVFIDDTRVVVSFGPWGDLAVVDFKQATVGDPLQVGASAEAMCRVAGGRVVVIDSKKNSIHLVDPNAKTVLKTIPVKPIAAQMRWAVPDLEIEVADAQGKSLGTVELPRQSAQKHRGAN